MDPYYLSQGLRDLYDASTTHGRDAEENQTSSASLVSVVYGRVVSRSGGLVFTCEVDPPSMRMLT